MDRKVTSHNNHITIPLVQLNVEITDFTSKTPPWECTSIPRAVSQDLRQQNWDQDSSHGFTCTDTHSQDTQGNVQDASGITKTRFRAVNNCLLCKQLEFKTASYTHPFSYIILHNWSVRAGLVITVFLLSNFSIFSHSALRNSLDPSVFRHQ